MSFVLFFESNALSGAYNNGELEKEEEEDGDPEQLKEKEATPEELAEEEEESSDNYGGGKDF